MQKSMLIKNMPESERPREKLLYYGVDGLSNAELLAIVIQSGTSNLSALELSNNLLCGATRGIASLGDYTEYELMEIKGIGYAKACRILAAIELGKRVNISKREIISYVFSPEDVANKFIAMLGHLMHEESHVCLVNMRNEVIAHKRLFVGSLNASIMHPREIFIYALKNGAAGIILIHNHPSGNVTPSREDIDVTNRIVKSGEVLGIHVLDHIIIGDGKWHSMKKEGNIIE